ncbi:MAG: hypothetical protein U0802_06315 [Candidatus Binatia bacterium]
MQRTARLPRPAHAPAHRRALAGTARDAADRRLRRCARAPGCAAARDRDDASDAIKPLRHGDAASGELAALRALAADTSVPLAAALDAYARLQAAVGDRAVDGAMPPEFSVRLPAGGRRPGSPALRQLLPRW